MYSCRSTNPRYLGLILLVTFVLSVTDDLTVTLDESLMFGCEPAIKPVFMEPGSDENPSCGTPAHNYQGFVHGNHPLPAPDTVLARDTADRIALIRGPPDGYRKPA